MLSTDLARLRRLLPPEDRPAWDRLVILTQLLEETSRRPDLPLMKRLIRLVRP